MAGRSLSSRQRLGVALIASGVVLSPVAAFDVFGQSIALGVAAILLLALGASLLPDASDFESDAPGRPPGARAPRAGPRWLHLVWLCALVLMALLLGYAIDVADGEDVRLKRMSVSGHQLLTDSLLLHPPAVTASTSPALPPPVAMLPSGL